MINKKYLKRKIDEKLIKWKESEDHLPLIVSGARQVGKSSSILHFANTHYKNVIEINFIDHPEYKKILDDGYSAKAITKIISLLNPQAKFIKNNTLIFFDEIQELPDVLTSLKFFYLDGQYDVICSGSLLGVHYKLVKSFGVGYSTSMTMNALDFEEFLWANGYGEDLINDILEHMVSITPFSDIELKRLYSLFFDFCITGGLPRVVENYISKGTFENCIQLQKDLVIEYKKDVAKYHEKLDQIKILNTFESIPIFLSKENKKFMPSLIRKKGTLDEYMPCIQWLKDAGLALICHNLETPQIPLQGNYSEEKFKIYFFDTGLLLSMLDPESQEDFRINKNFGIYKGGLYENIVAEAISKQGRSLYYYKKENSMLEEDFFLRTKDSVVPIEVKAGNNKAKSLSTLIKNKNYKDIEFGIKLINGNIGYCQEIYTLPHFTSFLLSRFLEEKKR